MLAVIDYGAGNLFSVQNAFRFLGIETEICCNADKLYSANGLILPGVGAFPDAMKRLHASGLVPAIWELAEGGKPLLGICLGMQMLFERGYEFEETEGLGLIPGEVRLLQTDGLKLPHIGWNSLEANRPCPLLSPAEPEPYVYFVHSYGAVCRAESVAAYTDYGGKVPALVQNGTVFGAQFHPEKSGEAGLEILRRFALLSEETPCEAKGADRS